jgi:pantoate ligase / CMP/dCMP kinase
LAYSSRNQYLSPTGKIHAAGIYRSLQQAKALFDRSETNPQILLAAILTELNTIPEFTLEYLEIIEPNTLQPIQQIDREILIAIAGRIEGTRLIDNILLG